MSEASSWKFDTALETDGLDIASIFGPGTSAADVNPFETQQSGPAPETQPARPSPVPGPRPEKLEKKQEKQKEPERPQSEEPPAGADPIGAAFEKAETDTAKKAAKSLFEKSPVFSYGSAREEITDGSMTFEELRIVKADDFPELSEGKRVSWTVEYGKVSKPITDPKGTTVASVKEEIERSKAFLDGLKKAKDKNPDCLVKPRVTAQSKGIAGYKGVFTSLEEARASEKPICLIPASDGRVYELRRTELGDFVAPKHGIVDFQTIRAGFSPALPLIPLDLLQQIISFFRCYMSGPEEFEALAHILWDREEEKFVVRVPRQTVSKTHINADLTEGEWPEERYLHYADIHSHNSMAAKFSLTDDRDEQATRIYIVLGRLDRFFPEISVRMCCGGSFQELDPGTVLEGLGAVFPRQWRDNVRTQAVCPRADRRFRLDKLGGGELEAALGMCRSTVEETR